MGFYSMNKSNNRQHGYIVRLPDGREGRTIHSKGEVNGKIPVYLQTDDKKGYSDTAILCDPAKISVVGFID